MFLLSFFQVVVYFVLPLPTVVLIVVISTTLLNLFFESMLKEKVTSQSQSKRFPRTSLPAANLMAEMETMAPRRGSMDDSFHLPNFPRMAWVDPSALPAIVTMPSLRARFECTRFFIYKKLI